MEQEIFSTEMMCIFHMYGIYYISHMFYGPPTDL